MLSVGTSLGVSSVRQQLASGVSPLASGTLNISWVQINSDDQISTDYIDIIPGAYDVTINVSNFVTSGWGSHGLVLLPSLDSTWTNASSNQFYFLSIEDPSILFFGLNDPNIHSTQTAIAIVNTTEPATRFNLFGRLPLAGDTANFTITFTPRND
jgi:hypothetical protein